ncbi:MAG: AIM24 family protein [Methanosarcinaceae archaeon]|nr:AIM24 family protein [Methanosarcinaceae archaeon]
MEPLTIEEFVNSRMQKEQKNHEKFYLETDRILEIDLDGKIFMKHGAMISYDGSIKFEKTGISDHGLNKYLKQKITGEELTLTKAIGNGKLYLADYGKKILLLKLNDEGIIVNGSDVLAFEDTINYDVVMMKTGGAALAGGIFNINFSGSGLLAITTYFEPLVLKVIPGKTVYTDPGATVAWSNTLAPTINTDITLKTLTGRSSGETIQMKFEGNGFVVVQPYETY